MKDELLQIAKRVNWFESPEKIVKDVDRFLIYFMQYCLDTDISVMRHYYTVQQFRHALESRPPGIMDDRSVAYWTLILNEGNSSPAPHLSARVQRTQQSPSKDGG